MRAVQVYDGNAVSSDRAPDILNVDCREYRITQNEHILLTGISAVAHCELATLKNMVTWNSDNNLRRLDRWIQIQVIGKHMENTGRWTIIDIRFYDDPEKGKSTAVMEVRPYYD